MAYPKEFTLAEHLVVSGEDVLTPGHELGINRQYAQLQIHVTAVVGDTACIVIFQTAKHGTDWVDIDQTEPLGAVGVTELALTEVSKHLRARIQRQGDDSVELTITGVSHQVFCTPRDIKSTALPDQAFSEMSDEEMMQGCLAATDEAMSYLGASFDGPLVSWGGALRLHTANMAAYHLLKQRGIDVGNESMIRQAYEDALEWLQRGAPTDPTILDASPGVGARTAYGVSQPRRGWPQ
jgi:hypothetical protein